MVFNKHNTPTIIRYPFEQMTANWLDATLVRIGRSCAEVPARLKGKSVSIDDGIQLALNKIQEQKIFPLQNARGCKSSC